MKSWQEKNKQPSKTVAEKTDKPVTEGRGRRTGVSLSIVQAIQKTSFKKSQPANKTNKQNSDNWGK